jgi:hypothetical protein
VVVVAAVVAGATAVVDASASEFELSHAASSRHVTTAMVTAPWRIAAS